MEHPIMTSEETVPAVIIKYQIMLKTLSKSRGQRCTLIVMTKCSSMIKAILRIENKYTKKCG